MVLAEVRVETLCIKLAVELVGDRVGDTSMVPSACSSSWLPACV